MQQQNQNQDLPIDFREPMKAEEERLSGVVGASVDIPTLARQDIAAQKKPEQDKFLELDTKFNKLMGLTNKLDLNQTDIDAVLGDNRLVGDMEITPQYLQSIQNNQTEQALLYEDFFKEEVVPTAKVYTTITPFYDQETQTVRLPKEAFKLPVKQQDILRDAAQRSAEVAQLLDRSFGKNSPLPQLGKQVILNTFSNGDFFTEFKRTARDFMPEMARLLPDFATMLYNAAGAVVDKGFEDESIDESFGTYYDRRMGDYAGSELRQAYENMLNDSVVFESAYKAFNKWYKDSFYDQYQDQDMAKDAWFIAHGSRPRMEIFTGEDGQQELRHAKDEETGEFLYDDNPLSKGLVYDLLKMSYGNLSTGEQAVLIGLEFLPITYGVSALNLAKTKKYGDIVIEGRKRTKKTTTDTGEVVEEFVYSPSATDLEVFRAERRRRLGRGLPGAGIALAGLSNAKNWITLSTTRGTLKQSTRMDDHLQNIQSYDNAIHDIRNELDEVGMKLKNAKVEGLDTDDIKTLESTRDELQISLNAYEKNYKSYKVRVGFGAKKDADGDFVAAPYRLDSPFTRQVLVDDAIIAGAIAYAPEILSASLPGSDSPLMDKETAEVISYLTLPFVAPYAFRKGAAVAFKIANTATVGVPMEIVRFMEFTADKLDIIPEGALIGGDLNAIKANAAKRGIALSDSDLDSLKVLNKMFNAMRPEYREKAFRALGKYHNTMKTLRKEMVELNMPAEVVADNMKTLQLSLAEATGLAPLIAVQNQGKALNVRDVTSGKVLNEQLDAMASQQDKIDAMAMNLDIFIKRVEQNAIGPGGEKISIANNQVLQNAIGSVAAIIDIQTKGIVKTKIELASKIDKILKSPIGDETINPDTVETVIRISEELAPETAATLKKAFGQPGEAGQLEAIKKARVELLEMNLRGLDQLRAFSSGMKSTDIDREARRTAENFFNTIEGTYEANASIKYRALDNLTDANGNKITVDLEPLAQKMKNIYIELQDKPLRAVLMDGTKSWKSGGKSMYTTLTRAALRGLKAEGYTTGDISNMIKSLRDQKGDDNLDIIDLVFEMRDEFARQQSKGNVGADVTMPSYIKATASEAERLNRFFKDKAYSLRENADKFEIDGIHTSLDNFTMKAFEKYPGLVEGIKDARAYYEVNMGARFLTPGTYGYDVRVNRVRKDAKGYNAEGGLTGQFRNREPIYIFKRIEDEIQKAFTSKTEDDKQNAISNIASIVENELMPFIGANRGNGKLGLDPDNKEHALIIKNMQQVINLLGTKVLSGKLSTEVATEVGKFQRGSADYKAPQKEIGFSRANDIIEIEKALQIPVIKSDGTVDGTHIRLFEAGEVNGFAKDFDEMLVKNADVQKEFDDLVGELNDESSALRITAGAEIDAEKAVLDKMKEVEDRIKDPDYFVKRYVIGQTKESIQDTINEFTNLTDLTREEVVGFFRYQYIRQLKQEANIQYGISKDSVRKKGEIVDSDLRVIIDRVSDPTKRQELEAVFDADHLDHLEAIADWAQTAAGDALNIRALRAAGGYTLNSVYSRVFNLARGMVSLPYVGAEVASKVFLVRDERLIEFALRDRNVAGLLVKALDGTATDPEIKTLATRLRSYVAYGIATNGGTVPDSERLNSRYAGQKVSDVVQEKIPPPEQAFLESQAEKTNETVQ